MISTTLALIAGTLAAAAAPPAGAPAKGGSDPITATYVADGGSFCIRSGWNTASFKINRLVKPGECRTAAAWKARGIEFDAQAAARIRPLASQVASR
jgi:hypothetical protein